MEKRKVNKKMMIFCEPCSFKLIMEENQIPENLVEIKSCSVQGGIPEIDPKTGRIKTKKEINQSKKYKCPKCGRGTILKQLQGAYVSTIKQIESKEEAKKREEEYKQRIEDGKPLERTNLEN